QEEVEGRTVGMRDRPAACGAPLRAPSRAAQCIGGLSNRVALALDPTGHDRPIVALYRSAILADDHGNADLGLRRRTLCANALTAQCVDVDVALGSKTAANWARGEVLLKKEAVDFFFADVAS